MSAENQCPVCAMEVNPHLALSEPYDGQSYYFCSEGCREQFLKDPKTYVGE
ncbi:YHS domain-containing protein [Tessaracoccus caeni]|uniref:YHS domain-containing protein n=1 Tax=Tessaracoccus caeni TaxID=3031239 RepID=UPI0023DB8B9A|nr:YHS domain-containing protein [Tessaracoccus caeni]MDF1488610.1 YHS domain-containing protein [Tessaracoccus caeni]